MKCKPLNQDDLPLELIKDLGTEYATELSTVKTRFGIFKCPNCDNPFRTSVARVKNGGTTQCTSCASRISATTHGQSKRKGYKTWEGILARCHNKNHEAYHNYGGRGIYMWERWKTDPKAFINYISDLDNAFLHTYTLDRKDNQKGYEPNNLQWVTKQDQSANTRADSTALSKYKGVSWDAIRSQWLVRCMISGTRHTIGRFIDEKEAAKAYDTFCEEKNIPNKLTNKGSDLYEN